MDIDFYLTFGKIEGISYFFVTHTFHIAKQDACALGFGQALNHLQGALVALHQIGINGLISAVVLVYEFQILSRESLRSINRQIPAHCSEVGSKVLYFSFFFPYAKECILHGVFRLCGVEKYAHG